MGETDWDKFMEEARERREQLRKEQDALPIEQQDRALVGEIEPILNSFFPEFPRHAALGNAALALLRTIVSELWDELLDLADTTDVDKFVTISERNSALHRALGEIAPVMDRIMIEHAAYLRGQSDVGGDDD